MQVFAADDDGTLHFGRDDGAGHDTAADGDEAGEGAFLVCTREKVGLASCASTVSCIQVWFLCVNSVVQLHPHPITPQRTRVCIPMNEP